MRLIKGVKGNKRNKGSITVYLCIIMSSVILVGGVLADIARINCAGAVAQDVTVSVSRSLMSLYNSQLQKFYGIMGVEINPEIKESIKNLILKNIKVDEGADLFNLKMEGLSLQGKENLANKAFLMKQINAHCVDDLAREWITEKIEGFKILGDLYKNRSLISTLLPYPAIEASESFAKINDSLKEGGELGESLSGLAEQVLLNEYILKHFSCYTGGTNQASIKSDEVEFILTGVEGEVPRKATVIALLTGTRFALNIGYFVTSPLMMQKAMTYALAVAGWSGVGVPIAQAAIIVTWSLAESAIDVQQLLDGSAVPLVKSINTWVLSETGLLDAAKSEVAKRTKEAVNSVVDDTFDSIEAVVSKAVSEVEANVETQLTQLVNKLTGPLEKGIQSLADKGLNVATTAVNGCFENIEKAVEDFKGDGIIFETLKAYAQDWIGEIKDNIKQEVADAVSTPQKIIDKYKKMLIDRLTLPIEKIKEKIISEVKVAGGKGREALKDKLTNLFIGQNQDSTGSLAASNFKSGFITMRYKDYLRLYLLTVSENQKFERVRDLIENNIRAVSNDEEFSLSRLSCGVEVSVDLSTNYFLTPQKLIPSNYKTLDGKRHLISKKCDIYYLTGAKT